MELDLSKTIKTTKSQEKHKTSEKEWSSRIHNRIKQKTSTTPWTLKCILIYNSFFNNVINKILSFVVDDIPDKDWSEIVGSNVEKTCVSSSDVDFIQVRGYVFASAEDVPRYMKEAYLVYTEDNRIPPGSCWLRMYDTTRYNIGGSTNGLEYFVYKGDEKQQMSTHVCSATEIHYHKPEKAICYAAARKQREDGSICFSRLKYTNFLAKQGLTIYKSVNSFLPQWREHGPAFTQTYFGLFKVDVVYSLP